MRTSMTTLLAAVLLLPAMACVQRSDVSTTHRRDPVYAGLVGQWQGTVEVVDAGNSSRRVTRSTQVHVIPVKGSDMLEMRFTTKSAQNGIILNTDRIRLDEALTSAQWGEAIDGTPLEFTVHVDRSPVDNTKPLRLVLEGEGYVSDCADSIRATVTIAPGEIRMVREARTVSGAYVFLSAYSLRRVS